MARGGTGAVRFDGRAAVWRERRADESGEDLGQLSKGSLPEFLNLPPRSRKPREDGITHVLDRGLGLEEAKVLLEGTTPYVDVVKLGWGTAYLQAATGEKVAFYQSCDIAVTVGGTLFEIALAQGRLDKFLSWLRELKIGHLEISDGVRSLPLAEKLALVRELKADFRILVEVGSKLPEDRPRESRWGEEAEAVLAAGAWKVITEGRESGTSGSFFPTGAPREDLLERVVAAVGVENLLFEAPRKEQQCWFIRRYGPGVNLGNVFPGEVIPLETLRCGLRAETAAELSMPHEDRNEELPYGEWEICGGRTATWPSAWEDFGEAGGWPELPACWNLMGRPKQ